MENNNFDNDRNVNGERSELTIIEIFDFFASNALIIGVFMLIGIAISVALYSYIPYKWKADITIQIGKVPVLERLDYVIPPSEVAENIKSPLFLSEIVSTIYGHDIPVDSPSARLVYDDLKVSVVKGTDLVKIQVFGWTGPDAYKNASVVAERVVAKQRVVSERYLVDAKKLLGQIEAELQRNRGVLDSAKAIDQRSPSRTESNALLKLTLIDAKNSEIQKLQMEQTRLSSLISLAQLHETRVVGRSLVPRKPVWPRAGLFVLAGTALGFLLGLMFAIGRIARRRGVRDLLSGW